MSVLAGDIAGQGNVLAKSLGQSFSDWGQGVLSVYLSLGAAKVRGQNDLSAAFHQSLDGGKRSVNATRVSNVSFFIKGNIEIRTNKDVTRFDAFLEKIIQSLESHYFLLLKYGLFTRL